MCHSRPTRLSKREEDRKRCMCRWRRNTLVAVSQKKNIGKMWTMFEEDRCVTIAWMVGHFARSCRRKGKGKGKTIASMEDPREDIRENGMVGDTRDSAGRAARSDTSRQNVDGGVSLTSMRKMQTAEEAEDNMNWKSVEKWEVLWIVARKRIPASLTYTVRWKKAPAAWGADASTGQAEFDVMICSLRAVVHDDIIKKLGEQRDGVSKIHGDQRVELSEMREDRRDGFGKKSGGSRRRVRSKVEAKDMPTTGENGRSSECQSKQ